MKSTGTEEFHRHEQHAYFWESLWTFISLVSLVLMFVLLYMRVRG
jgi:hypothetical protein